MTNFVDEMFGAESQPVDLGSVVEATPLPSYPEKSIKNRAAQVAMTSPNPVEDYQLMVMQAQGGDDSMIKAGQKLALDNSKQTDMKTTMMILSDPRYSYEQKRAAVQGIANNPIASDLGMTLFSKNLESPSKGETIEHEDARISTADAVNNIYRSRRDIQGIVNAHAASLRDGDVRTVAEAVESNLFPFANNILAGQVATGVDEKTGGASFWKKLKNYVFGGSASAGLSEKLAAIPPEKRVEFAQQIVDSIRQNSGIIFSTDNQYAQFEKASSIFAQGGYSGTQEFIENISPLLDIIGIGQLTRGGGKAAKVAGMAFEEASTASRSEAAFMASQRARGAGQGVSDVEPKVKAGVPATKGYDEVYPIIPEERRIGGPAQPQIGDVTDVEAKVSQNRRLTYDRMERVEKNAISGEDNPASPAAIVASANPERAREIHAMVLNSPTEEMAEAAYGTNKVDALGKDLFPKIGTGLGYVEGKVSDIDKAAREQLDVPPAIMEQMNNSGLTYFTPAERHAGRAAVVNSYTAANNLTINPAMSQFTMDGQRMKISAVYGNDDGPFTNARQAMEQAKFNLRSQGIKDEDITVLRNEGLEYVPVDVAQIGDAPGNYLVRVDVASEITAADVPEWSVLNVKRNWFDRFASTMSNDKGSLSRWIFDPASMLDPTIAGSAFSMIDRTASFGKLLLEQASEFSNQYVRLPKPSKAMIDDYIKEANFNNIPFDVTDLTARGFNAEEIGALRSWKKYWDGQFYLENNDMVRSLNHDGYQVMDNAGTTLYARPVAKDQNIVTLFDPSTGGVVLHAKADGDALYAAGGTYAKLRRPINVNGTTVEYMISRENAQEYFRKIRDTDSVLNYRNGYYTVTYQSPRFVDQVVRDPAGRELYTRAVAVAGNTDQAQRFIDRMVTSQGLNPNDFKIRGDVRQAARDSDTHWDLSSGQGRIAQRIRGQQLEDASGLNHIGDGDFIRHPIESAITSARSVSARTIGRPWLEATKTRAVRQYGDVFPKDQFGNPRWPNSISEIGEKGVYSSKEIADARTTYEYVGYMENGYINSMDTMFKNFFQGMSEWVGETGTALDKAVLERGLARVADVNVTASMKKGVFTAYLAANPLRQIIVQMNQVTRTFAYNPQGWITGSIPGKMVEYMNSVMQNGKQTAFTNWVNKAGFLSNVDQHNLVRGSLMEAANATSHAGQIARQALHAPQQIGFNAGEMGNLLGHAAAVFDRYERAGYNIAAKDIQDQMTAELRAITYGQNYAGDMPYNQTSPAIFLQFMQVPQKAYLQSTNRMIPRAVRARMMAADIVLWGVPGAAAAGYFLGADVLPDNPKLREVVVDGYQSLALNETLNLMFTQPGDERSKVDFSSMAPYDLTGWSKMYHALLEGGLIKMGLNSPAGQLFLKDGGRIPVALQSMGRYFSIIDPIDQEPEEFLGMLNDVAKISSGWNNAVKARLMLETKKKVDQYGRVTDNSVTSVEAFAQALGFSTQDEKKLYEISQELRKNSKAYKDEVLKNYNDIKRYYQEKFETTNADPRYITGVTGWALKAYADDPQAQQIIYDQWAKDMLSTDTQLLKQMFDASGIKGQQGLKDLILQAPIDDAQKSMLMQRIEDMNKARAAINPGKK